MACSWVPLALQPTSNIDQSWVASLYMAVHDGLNFGTRAVFTYGPLGFLEQPEIFHVHLVEVAFLYTFVMRLALAVLLYRSARAMFGSVAGFVIALVVMGVAVVGVAQFSEMTIFLIGAVLVIQRQPTGRAALAAAAGAGALAGLELLTKMSIGATIAVMTAILVASMPSPRRDCYLAAAAAFSASLLLFWLLAGEDLSALPNFISTTIPTITGYAPAMSVETPGLYWEYTAALLGLGLGVWAALSVSESASARARAGLVLLWVAFWFSNFKEAFVRHDPGHGLAFFCALLLSFFAFRQKRDNRAIAVVCIGALLVTALATQSASLTDDLRFANAVSSFVSDAVDVAVPSRAHSIERAGIAAVRQIQPIPAALLPLLRGHTVDIYPIDQILAWAYGLRWDPIPVFQSYQAYTSSLDALDADFLASNLAPQRILFEGNLGVDNRIGNFDESDTLRTMLCRYDEIAEAGPYAVLARTADRCRAASQLIMTVRANWGQTVAVLAPAPGRWIVFVRIYGTAVAGSEKLVSFLFRPKLRYIYLNGSAFRLITGTATDGLLLRASPGVDYPQPFNLSVNAYRIAVTEGSDPSTPRSAGAGTPLTFAFYAQRLS